MDDRAKAKAEREGRTIIPDSTAANQEIPRDAGKTASEIEADKKQQKLNDREARQKELEERRQKILADREKAKKEREEQKKKTDSVPNNNNN